MESTDKILVYDANILTRYRLIISINLACIIGICICLFAPLNK